MDAKRFKLKFLVTGGVVLAFFLVSAAVLFGPLWKNIGTLGGDITISKKLLSDFQTMETRYSELKKMDAEVEEKFPLVADTFLSEKGLFDFVVKLENLAKESDCVLAIDHSAQSEVAIGDFQTADFQLTLWGGFPAAYDFLYSLENLKYKINVSDIKIAKLDDLTLPVGPKYAGIGKDDVSAIVKLNVYYYKQ